MQQSAEHQQLGNEDQQSTIANEPEIKNESEPAQNEVEAINQMQQSTDAQQLSNEDQQSGIPNEPQIKNEIEPAQKEEEAKNQMQKNTEAQQPSEVDEQSTIANESEVQSEIEPARGEEEAKNQDAPVEKGVPPEHHIKYVFLCGSVASGIGKGITNSSIGLLLKDYGYEVSFMKIDPYLNLDAGTMSPYEHGEVFVTEDGGEVDLDLGNYERFMDINLTKQHSLTTGKLFDRILKRERQGEYLGKTVQMIPHVTNMIKDWIKECAGHKVSKSSNRLPEIFLIEVGGTVGDIESTHYYEAIRQMIMEEGRENVALIQLAYIMEIGGEQKTKPAQNGIKDLRYTGLQADFVVCRSEQLLGPGSKQKLSTQGSVPFDQIISVPNVPNIYSVPWLLAQQRMIPMLLKRLELPLRVDPNLMLYNVFARRVRELHLHPKKYIIGIFGKYMEKYTDSYMSLCKAILEASYEVQISVVIKPFDLVANTGKLDLMESTMKGCDGVIVPGGFGERAWEDKIWATKLAREMKKPFIGICYGFQAAVCAQVRYFNEEKDPLATTHELKQDEWNDGVPPGPHDYLMFMPENERRRLGGTMRCGVRTSTIKDKNSLAYKIYGTTLIEERHRHRFEVNVDLLPKIIKGEGQFTATDKTRQEIFELPESVHPFYFCVQYHPELISRNLQPHPIFVYFLYKVAGREPPNPTILKGSDRVQKLRDLLVKKYEVELRQSDEITVPEQLKKFYGQSKN